MLSLQSAVWLCAAFSVCAVQMALADYTYIEGETPVEASCPGYYCGRMRLDSGNWSSCQSCPRGFRSDAASTCERCTASPTFYDFMYLTFMALLSLSLHWHFIDRHARSRSMTCGVLVQHVSALLECLLAAVVTVLLTDPLGSLQVRSCRVVSLADWYTVLFNPTPNYERALSCTQEAAYPLYSMVFLYYTLSLLAMVLLRPWLAARFLPERGARAVCAALYFLPTLILAHAFLAGVLYTVFPYLVIVSSVGSVALHLASQLTQQPWPLLRTTVTEPRNAVVVLAHWLLHAFGIVAFTELQRPLLDWLLLLLVPFPTVFYMVTVRFTEPMSTLVGPAPAAG